MKCVLFQVASVLLCSFDAIIYALRLSAAFISIENMRGLLCFALLFCCLFHSMPRACLFFIPFHPTQSNTDLEHIFVAFLNFVPVSLEKQCYVRTTYVYIVCIYNAYAFHMRQNHIHKVACVYRKFFVVVFHFFFSHVLLRFVFRTLSMRQWPHSNQMIWKLSNNPFYARSIHSLCLCFHSFSVSKLLKKINFPCDDKSPGIFRTLRMRSQKITVIK